MLLAPGPILLGSMALSRYARSDRPAPPSTNEVVIRGQQPEAVPSVVADSDERLVAACEEHANVLRRRLGESCHVVTAAPFVIAGDLSTEELAKWQSQTIAPAAEALALRYFAQRPTEPITVLLWSSHDSYEHYAEQLFGDRGISIYGYYKTRERTLVLNIATGAGTLVHELTHALVAFDCPDVPDWFNEGLASLHEQCRFRSDERGPLIEGLVNWRLKRLQSEALAGELPPLEILLRDDDFRGQREGINYAQARYLCLYLQERKLLERFYHELRLNIERDTTGEATLQAMFPGQSWTEINADYLRFVRNLPPVE